MVYGGGVLVQYGMYNATATRHVGNAAEWGGGGAISLFSAVALLRGCELSGNRASFGGGLNAMRMAEGNIVVPTIVSVNVSPPVCCACPGFPCPCSRLFPLRCC